MLKEFQSYFTYNFREKVVDHNLCFFDANNIYGNKLAS